MSFTLPKHRQLIKNRLWLCTKHTLVYITPTTILAKASRFNLKIAVEIHLIELKQLRINLHSFFCNGGGLYTRLTETISIMTSHKKSKIGKKCDKNLWKLLMLTGFWVWAQVLVCHTEFRVDFFFSWRIENKNH